MPQINSNNVLWKEMDGKVVVLRIETGSFFELNAIGSDIWRRLADGKDRDAIIEALGEIYDVSRQALSADVDGFLKRMTKQGLLEK